MRITLISDTHNKQRYITEDLLGGDLLLHGGDISSMGYKHEIQEFCKWFNSLDNYDTVMFEREDGWIYGTYFAFNMNNFPDDYFKYNEENILKILRILNFTKNLQ